MKIKKLSLLVLFLITAPFILKAQDEEEDETKMIREVISVQMEKPAAPPPPPKAEEPPVKGKKGKKKPVEEPVIEEIPADTGSNMIPATVAELQKRANNWYNSKHKKYIKSMGTTAGSTVSCTVTMPYKPKELNPQHDVEGEFTMLVTIECKEGKYRYTINKIEHKAKRGVSSGGDVFSEIPACGSVNLNAVLWKQLRSAALTNAKLVADDLKVRMQIAGSEGAKKKGDW